MDFTIQLYSELLLALQEKGVHFQTFLEYIKDPQPNSIVLRHDVDRLPNHSLKFAHLQAEKGIQSTYYFRIVPQSFNIHVISAIVTLGHEVGYHYETMDSCDGDIDKAYEAFCNNLEKFRKIANISTISMHGSPLSKFDNREIWYKYDYKKLGIIAEPYFDINVNELFYLTDTGRRWNSHLYNIRDKSTKENPVTNPYFLKLSYNHTKDIISAIRSGSFPEKAMVNFHPQRWSDNLLPWMKELIWQNIKNQGKRLSVLNQST